ncbi:MAG TPA: SDR family oxidoreductase [Candidatus Xenobia bacterium]|jgi:NAD(P)-dependent dehydrogenase (short-subunit alcohol dehydrogenase family)
MKRRVVVVTGASAGVGRAIARAFGRQQAAIGLLARGTDGLDACAAEIEALGGEALPLMVDVAHADAVQQAADRIEERLGPIDIWVNNAMVSVFSPFVRMTPEEFRRVTEVTYLGTVYGTMAALKGMRQRDHGTIVQIGSALAYRSIPLQSAYCGAKHGIEGFTESVRTELLHDKSNVVLTMVQLPAVNTPQFGWVKSRLPDKPQPVPPIYQPEMIAEAVTWLVDHPRRELVIGGSSWKAILGNHLVPGYIDRYLAQVGYQSQQTAEPVEPGRLDNLWQPVPGDHGAHGTFDNRAHTFTWTQLWSEHRGAILASLAALGLVALMPPRRRVPAEPTKTLVGV